MQTVEEVRRDRDALLQLLIDGGATHVIHDGREMRCPFHDDRNPSAGIYERDGVWRFKCHSGSCGFGGDFFDVAARLAGTTPEHEVREWSSTTRRQGPPRTPQARQAESPAKPKEEKQRPGFPDLATLEKWILKARGRIEIRYDEYQNPDGSQYAWVWRYISTQSNEKAFCQAYLGADGSLVVGLPASPRPLYGMRNFVTADTIILVEGEKSALALREIGFAATTFLGGVNGVPYADWSSLAGKRVYLWPDWDPEKVDKQTGETFRASFRAMKAAAKLLEAVRPVPQLFWIDPEPLQLPSKGDAFDFIAEWKAGDRGAQSTLTALIEDILADARPLGPSAELLARMEDIASGRYTCVPFPWPQMTRLSNALCPGTVTLICGDPNSAKSFMMVEAFGHWVEQNIPAAIYMLEDDREFHLQRALAQRCLNSKLIDWKWIQEHPEWRALWQQHSAWLDRLGNSMWTAPDTMLTLDQIADWIATRARDGARIIGVDPVTGTEQGKEPWVTDLAFLMRVKQIARHHGASVILVTHPKKGRQGKQIHMDEIAGSAAWSRFSHNIFWIEHLDANEDVEIQSSMGPYTAQINRIIHIIKCRNGPGARARLGFRYVGDSVTFDERGLFKKLKQTKEKES